MKASGHTAVMASRTEPPDSLDFFPTPPWATRALMRHVLPNAHGLMWEPAAGARHMADVLAEDDRFQVYASDVHDYGRLDEVGSFVGDGPDVAKGPSSDVQWVITNPPFRLAGDFALRALRDVVCTGLAMLVRTAWLEGTERFRSIFEPHPPTIIAQFSERVPMVKGRWDPDASTATSYCWIVWRRGVSCPASFIWIPPGRRTALTRPDDARRFAGSA